MMPLPATLLDRSAAAATYALTLAPELPAFQGHFPGDPVLPGVVLVDWAARLGQEAFGPLGAFLGLDQVTFLAPVRPGDPLELALALEAGILRFRYQTGGIARASGAIRWAGAP